MKGQPFKTSDMWMAAALMASGEDMVGVERGQPRAMFVFSDSLSIDETSESYRAGKLRIEPRKLLVQVKLLKSSLYDG